MRHPLRRLSCLIACGLIFGVASPLRALRFTEKYTDKGSHILVVRDCKNFSVYIPEFRAYDQQHPCRSGKEDDEEGFEGPTNNYVGDEAELEFLLSTGEHGSNLATLFAAARYAGDQGTAETIRKLIQSPKPFDEVWLLSGGGDVDAGVGVARVLRKHGMTVEVPDNYHCVSACTLAFMGGVLRYISDTATFQVHSASAFEGGLDKRTAEALLKNPSAELAAVALSQQIDARFYAMRILTLFQTTLSVPLHTTPRPEDDAAFCKNAGGLYENMAPSAPRYICDTDHQVLTSARLPYAEPDNPERAADAALIRREGVSAMQDILMRVERTCMAAALDDLEASAQNLGPRAKPALKMLRAMYMTSIKDTSYMTHLQLVTMGYVTETLQ